MEEKKDKADELLDWVLGLCKVVASASAGAAVASIWLKSKLD